MRLSVQAAAVCVIAGAVVSLLGMLVYNRFRRPKDPEAYRRHLLEKHGRLVEGMVFDVRESIVFYSWTWRGVQYDSSQDVTAIAHLLPEERNMLIGPAAVRFHPRDPSNSIVVSENWNGFGLHSSGV